MGWLEDDEMKRPWEEVGEEEEKITVRRNEGSKIEGEGMQYVPMKKEAKKEKKVVGRLVRRKDEGESERDLEDTDEVVQVERIVRGNECGSCGDVEGRGGKRRVRARDVLSRWNGGSSKELRDISLGSGVKIVG